MVTTFTPGGSDGSSSFSFAFTRVDDPQRVLALPHHDDARDDVAGAVEIGDAAPEVGPERDGADVAHAHRRRRGRCRASTISPMSSVDFA